MTDNVYCSMIHGGLAIDVKHNGESHLQHCCLRNDKFPIHFDNVWNNKQLLPLRETNIKNTWDPGCANCKNLEKSGLASFRQGMNSGLGINGLTNLSGPARLDLMFDNSCNLACRTCNPSASTFWQHHLKENGLWSRPIQLAKNQNKMISLLSTMNLENLRQVVFCGGETLLGNQHWEVARWLTNNVPNAKQQLTLCFQTNGTQPINQKHFEIIEGCHLVKLHVSLDGIEQQFEYLRWPASWDDVQRNLFELRQSVPGNVMFLIEQTISIFNVLYLDELDQWCKQNFATNREGDPVDCTKHLATGIYDLTGITEELFELLQTKTTKNLVPVNWKENPDRIRPMIEQIKKFDSYRQQSFVQTFPQLEHAYARYW